MPDTGEATGHVSRRRRRADQSRPASTGSIRRLAGAAGSLGLIAVLAGCFGDGIHTVGAAPSQVAPGLYTSVLTTRGLCFAERGQAGKASSVGGIYEVGGRSFVQVLATDTVVASSGCGEWGPPQATSYNPNRATAEVGAYRIPIDLLPGTYEAPGGAGCNWERVSSFTGSKSSVIARNESPGSNIRVTIADTDAGFLTGACGGWRRIGP